MLQAIQSRLRQWAIKAFTPGAWGRVLRLTGDHEMPVWADLSRYDQQATYYALSSWVYVAVSKIAEQCGQAEFEIYRRVNGELEAADDHPLELLLQKPNPWMSQVELLDATFGYLKLTGNAYWFLSGTGSQPDQIMILRPDRVRIAAGQDTASLIAGYIYEVDGQQIPLDPAEVIHFKQFNPKSDYYGLSPLEAAALATTNDLSMQRWNRNFFGKRNAIPSGLVNIKRPMTNDQYEQLKRDWIESVGGESRATMFLRGEDISWQDVAKSQRDMEFVLGREFSRDEIFQVYGIPSGMMNANSTEANAKTARETFVEDTIWPALVRFAMKLTAELAPFYGDDLVIKPVDVRPRDRALENAELVAQGQYMSVNEIRTMRLNLDRYEADPEADVPISLRRQAPSPFELAAAMGNRPNNSPNDNPPDQPPNDQNAPADESPNEEDATAEGKALTLTRTCRRELEQFARYASKGKDIDRFVFQATPLPVQIAAKALVDIGEIELLTDKALPPTYGSPPGRAKAEQAIEQGVSRYFLGLVQRLIEGVRHVDSPYSGKALPDLTRFLSYFDGTFWTQELAKLAGVMSPLIQDAVESGAVDAAKLLYMSTGVSFDPAVFNPKAAAFARDFTDQILKDFGTTTQDGTGAIIQRYVAQGDATLNDLVSALQQSGLYGGQRARIVGVTESTRAYGVGNYLAGDELARQAGVKSMISQADFARILPAHPYCRCGVQAMFQYDDAGNIIGIDFVWLSANDELVCLICGPRHGKLMSTLL